MSASLRPTRPRLPFHLPTPAPGRISALPSQQSANAEASSSAPESVSSADPLVASGPTDFTPFTQRTGVFARKRGMTALWDKNGTRWPVTVLQLDNVQVIRHSLPPANAPHLHSLQLGISDRPARTASFAELGYFAKAGVNPKFKIGEFRVTPDAVLPVGTMLSAAHYVPGQYVDVTANSWVSSLLRQGELANAGVVIRIGKGFQGGMKRHGFRGQPASHGTSLTHRAIGSTGANTSPARVFPGKKMPGHMGHVQRTQSNLLVHRIDTALNLVFVRGSVPGSDDCFVRIKDAVRKVRDLAQKKFKQGVVKEEWLKQGVKTLPMPAGTVERVKAEGWPEVVEWEGPALVQQ